jgi:hypothetical protein
MEKENNFLNKIYFSICRETSKVKKKNQKHSFTGLLKFDFQNTWMMLKVACGKNILAKISIFSSMPLI